MKETTELYTVGCPVCNRGRLIDIARAGSSHLFMTHPPKSTEQAQWFVKCPVCKKQIGLSIYEQENH